MYTSHLSERGTTLDGYPAQQITAETFSMDALANKYDGLTADTSKNSSGSCISPFGCTWSRDSSAYQAGVGRLLRHYVPSSQGGWVVETSSYDSAGSISAATNPGLSFYDPASERILMYSADGRLRAVHNRWVAIAAGDYKFNDRKYTFEEYRYDALGRRIWYRSVKTCYNPTATMEFYQQAECVTSLIRRTIWDGDQELAEIQMLGDTTTPATTLENDLTALNLPIFPAWKSAYVDQNPYFGHVLYTPGRGLDKALAVTRYNYTYNTDRTGIPITRQIPGPLTIMPFWSARGDATTGAFTNGAWKVCNPPTSQTICAGVVWTYFFSAYDRNRGLVWDNWQGTLLEEKRDKSGLSYMRNRYYDPITGRFTQEDPSGLAGGLNLYGFAKGDPVNVADPFGLTPLTQAEREALGPLCKLMDCNKIDVRRGNDGPVTNFIRKTILRYNGNRSFTLGNAIYLSDAKAHDLSTLIHEATHVVQAQSVGLRRYLDAGWGAREQENLGLDPYVYNPGQEFNTYQMEQQAQIVEDCANGVSFACQTLQPNLQSLRGRAISRP